MHRRTDFQIAVRGRRAGRRTLVAHVAVPENGRNAGQDANEPALVGFVVSRAIGPAVVRKRVQRRLRHLMLPHLSGLPVGTRVVVRALPAAATASRVVLSADLDAVLSRLLRRTAPQAARGARVHDVPLLP